MQSSTNNSVLSQPCKYLTDSYNSSLASAVHLNLFKSWLCQTDNFKLQQKLLLGAYKLHSLTSDISWKRRKCSRFTFESAYLLPVIKLLPVPSEDNVVLCMEYMNILILFLARSKVSEKAIWRAPAKISY